VRDSLKKDIVPLAKQFENMGFSIVATSGTYNFLKENGVKVEFVKKVQDGRPNIVDLIKNKEISFVINVPHGKKSRLDAYSIRRAILSYNIPYVTTIEAAEASIKGKSIDDASAETAATAAVAKAIAMPANGSNPGNKYKIQVAKAMVQRAVLACK